MKSLQLILTVTIGILLFSCTSQKPKIVFVENMKLFSEFDMAIELDKKLQQFSKKKTAELDSLSLSLENLTRELEMMKEIPSDMYQVYNDLRNATAFKQKNYEEEVYSMSQEYDEQIWERLNLFTTNFAEENEYDMVLGAAGNGSLMYAKDTLNITNKLINYCNNKYNGSNE